MLLGDVSLARRLEAAEALNAVECVEAQNRLDPNAGAEAISVGGGYAAFVRPGSPLNHAAGLGFSGPVTATEIDRLDSFFLLHGAAPAVDVCPLADSSLYQQLGRRGYRLAEFNNVLARPLTAADTTIEHGAAVLRASSSMAERWARTVAHGFLERAELTPEETETGLVLFHTSPDGCYLARVEEQDAGCGCLAIRNGLAILCADSTLPVFRRRGVHTALIAARLREAARLGCDLATAAALPNSTSQRNYEKHGFRVVYTRVVLTKDRV